MRFLNLKSAGVLVLAALVCGISGDARATGGGRDVGNGGGVWTCRQGESSQGRIRWIQLVDLFEGRSELGLNIPRASDLSFEALLDSVERKLFSVSRDYFAEYSSQMQKVRQNLQIREGIQLEIIDDALYSSRPAPETCDGGVIRYEQLANYRDDGVILVDQRLWSELPVIDKAALYVHEAEYALLRAKENVQDSRKARKVTGYLLSSAPTSDYAHLLTLPAPPAPQPPPNHGFSPNAKVPREGIYGTTSGNWCGFRVRHESPQQNALTLEVVRNPIADGNCVDLRRTVALGLSEHSNNFWVGTWPYSDVRRRDVSIDVRSESDFRFCGYSNTAENLVCAQFYLQ